MPCGLQKKIVSGVPTKGRESSQGRLFLLFLENELCVKFQLEKRIMGFYVDAYMDKTPILDFEKLRHIPEGSKLIVEYFG